MKERNGGGRRALFTQRQWRTAGALTTAGSALLAWLGASSGLYLNSPLGFILCWGGFLVLMLATFVIVWLDIRYIRLQYAIERRELFRETLGNEEFRRSILAVQAADKSGASDKIEPPTDC